MKKSHVMAVLSVMALAVACAPAGSKTVIMKSAAPAGGVAKVDASAASSLTADGKNEAPVMKIEIADELAKSIYGGLTVAAVEGKDGDDNKVFTKIGKEITCVQKTEKTDPANFSCTFYAHADGTLGEKAVAKKDAPAAPAAPAAKTEAKKDMCDGLKGEVAEACLSR